MNYLPLPDEILKKIFQYIHPIFEYKKYVDNVNYYNEISENLSERLYSHEHVMHVGTVQERIISSTDVATISCLQLEYLGEIEAFVKRNPRFQRPATYNNLSFIQYKKQFEVYISKKNLKRLENNLYIHRGEWFHPNEKDEINIYNDINVLHQSGTIRDLIFACIMNNVRGWKTNFQDFMLEKYFINTAISNVYEGHYINFVNYYYNDKNIKKYNNKFVPTRKSLIKKLLRL